MQARNVGRRTIRWAALAATAMLALAGVTAMAQPAGGHGHGPGHPGGMEIGQILGAVKGQLNLYTSQQLAWDNAVTETKRAHTIGRTNMQKVRDAMTSELANAEPNLAAVAAVADSVHADNQALRQGVRKQWLQVYAILLPEQKAIVRDALKSRMARMETMGARIREHMQKGG